MRQRPRSEAPARATKIPHVLVIVAATIALSTSLLAAAGLVGWVFLDRYRDPADVAPAGADTAQHEWRIEIVADRGLDALPPFDGHAQALNTNADRPGLPVVGAIVNATGIAEPRMLVYVLPAVMAAVTGLAAAGFARAAMRARTWSLPAYVAGVGASVQVALAANGYLEQLLVMPLLLAAGACVVAAGVDRRVHFASMFLLGAAFAVHWQFAAVFSGLLLLVSLGAVPGSVVEREAGVPWRRLPVVSTLATTAGGLVVGAAALLGIPGTPRASLGITKDSIVENLERQLPLYRFPAPAVAAVGGVVALLARRASRLSLWLLAPWALVPAGAAILYEAGRTVPVQRALTFALAIPILGVALFEGVVRAGRSSVGRVGPVLLARVAAAVLALLALVPIAWSVARTHEVWTSRPAPTSNVRLAQFQAVARYIGVAGRPAIVVVDGVEGDQDTSGADFGSVPMLRRLRAELEPDLIPDVTPYLGDPTALLEGRPTLRPDVPGFDETSLELWERVRPLLSRDPLVIVLRPFHVSFDRLVQDHPSWQVTDWLAIVRGPPQGSDQAQLPAPVAPTFGSLIGTGLLLLLGVGVVGIGWAWGTGPNDPIARACLAPATGVSVLVVAGLAAEHLGVQTGERGATLAIVVAAAGIIAAAARLFIDGRGPKEGRRS
jgi:hypothetical protein